MWIVLKQEVFKFINILQVAMTINWIPLASVSLNQILIYNFSYVTSLIIFSILLFLFYFFFLNRAVKPINLLTADINLFIFCTTSPIFFFQLKLSGHTHIEFTSRSQFPRVISNLTKSSLEPFWFFSFDFSDSHIWMLSSFLL